MKRKYKNITVPYRYYNQKKNYTCYILNDKEYFDLNKLFQDFIGIYLTYHFEVKEKLYEVHNLSEVIESLLENYETFNIPKEYKVEYSDEELKYLKHLQKALVNNELKIVYENPRELNRKDFNNRSNYNIAKEVYSKYKKVIVPKKIKINNHEYYVVAGEIYESLYFALEIVFKDSLYYQFGGTKKENNRNHLHSHSFDDLIYLIFTNSEQFKIHVFQKQFYSQQELDFLSKLSEKLRKMNFHSVTFNPDKIEYLEYWYLKDHKKYFKLIVNNLKWRELNREYKKAVLDSHKI